MGVVFRLQSCPYILNESLTPQTRWAGRTRLRGKPDISSNSSNFWMSTPSASFGADNVGSKQLQQIRRSLRDHAVVLMGKNTMIRKAIRGHLETNPALERLLPHIKGNVGFVFTKL